MIDEETRAAIQRAAADCRKKMPISPRATSGANSTGQVRVDRRRAPSRATVRSAALRPIDSALAKSDARRTVS
jgi:hypothetical protein